MYGGLRKHNGQFKTDWQEGKAASDLCIFQDEHRYPKPKKTPTLFQHYYLLFVDFGRLGINGCGLNKYTVEALL